MSNIVLAVVAHPDDEVIGVFGALAKHALKGDDVHVLILADGASSRDVKENWSSIITERNRKADDVAKLLGAKSVTCLSLPDNQLDTIPRLQLAKIIEEKITSLKVCTVYTHHRWDVNVDHQRAHEAVVIATRSMPGQSVKTVLFFETASSTEWMMPRSGQAFEPNLFIDITPVWETKLQALRIYEDEMRRFPHSRSYEAIEALGRWRGATAGVKIAEAFMVGRHIC